MELGNIIRNYRLKNKISQRMAAKLWNLTPSTLCNVEQGKQNLTGKVVLEILTSIVPNLGNQLRILEIEQNDPINAHEYRWKEYENKGAKRGTKRKKEYVPDFLEEKV